MSSSVDLQVLKVDQILRAQCRALYRVRREIYRDLLFDGGVVRLFKRTTPLTPNTAQVAPEQFVIDFGGGLALTDKVLTKTSDWTVVRYRWRGVPSGGRGYWSFTHVIDPAGKIVAQRDQRLPVAESGGSSWQEVHLRLPDQVPVTGLRLSIGVYDPPFATRLRIAALPSAAASRFTLTDQDTALITSY
jgi:hypothetical protein